MNQQQKSFVQIMQKSGETLNSQFSALFQELKPIGSITKEVLVGRFKFLTTFLHVFGSKIDPKHFHFYFVCKVISIFSIIARAHHGLNQHYNADN